MELVNSPNSAIDVVNPKKNPNASKKILAITTLDWIILMKKLLLVLFLPCCCCCIIIKWVWIWARTVFATAIANSTVGQIRRRAPGLMKEMTAISAKMDAKMEKMCWWGKKSKPDKGEVMKTFEDEGEFSSASISSSCESSSFDFCWRCDRSNNNFPATNDAIPKAVVTKKMPIVK